MSAPDRITFGETRRHHVRPTYGGRHPMPPTDERTGWVKVTLDKSRGPRVYRADSFAEAAKKLPPRMTATRFEWVHPSP